VPSPKGGRHAKLFSIDRACLLATLAPSALSAHIDNVVDPNGKRAGPQRILVLDGSTVHNVGELQLHVTNWGLFGSEPGFGRPFSSAPSAQWPAGSTTEYLFGAGLWVGALKNGVPAVTTAAFDEEFRPSQDLRDIMYRAAESSRGGDRLPSGSADDDRDGKMDEDWLNGYDDDGDGLVDEDFAAISKQMFSCQYSDNEPISIRANPTHNPLNIHVRQESYQWEEDRYDDFVGMQFWITNIGHDVLQDVYIAFFADGDAGSRDMDNYFDDDGSGFIREPARCTDLGRFRWISRTSTMSTATLEKRPGISACSFWATQPIPTAISPHAASASRRTPISRDDFPSKMAAIPPPISSATRCSRRRTSSAIPPCRATTAC
jgi:hypothetical protein